MGFVKWFLRCTPGLSVFCLLFLLESALKIVQTEWLSFFYPPFLRHVASPIVAQTIFISYSVFLHILALLFPLRLCASAWAATCEIRATHARSKKGPGSLFKGDGNGSMFMELELQQDLSKKSGLVTMAVVLPSYKEDIEILESSLRVLASHTLARSSYDVSHPSWTRLPHMGTDTSAGFPSHGGTRPERSHRSSKSHPAVFGQVS